MKARISKKITLMLLGSALALINGSCAQDNKSSQKDPLFDHSTTVPVNVTCDSHIQGSSFSLIDSQHHSAVLSSFTGQIYSETQASGYTQVSRNYSLSVRQGNYNGQTVLAIGLQIQGLSPMVLCAGVQKQVIGNMTYYEFESNQINVPELSDETVSIVVAPGVNSAHSYIAAESGAEVRYCAYPQSSCETTAWDAWFFSFNKQ